MSRRPGRKAARPLPIHPFSRIPGPIRLNAPKQIRAKVDNLVQEMSTAITSLNNRIDNLYQALFSRKDLAA